MLDTDLERARNTSSNQASHIADVRSAAADDVDRGQISDCFIVHRKCKAIAARQAATVRACPAPPMRALPIPPATSLCISFAKSRKHRRLDLTSAVRSSEHHPERPCGALLRAEAVLWGRCGVLLGCSLPIQNWTSCRGFTTYGAPPPPDLFLFLHGIDVAIIIRLSDSCCRNLHDPVASFLNAFFCRGRQSKHALLG